jgi:hypothetical protein
MVQSWYVHLIPRFWYLDSFAERCVGIHPCYSLTFAPPKHFSYLIFGGQSALFAQPNTRHVVHHHLCCSTEHKRTRG